MARYGTMVVEFFRCPFAVDWNVLAVDYTVHPLPEFGTAVLDQIPPERGRGSPLVARGRSKYPLGLCSRLHHKWIFRPWTRIASVWGCLAKVTLHQVHLFCREPEALYGILELHET